MLLSNMMRGGGLRIITPIVISANTANYNLFTAAGSPADAVDVLVTINAGVTVSSASTATYAFDTGIFPVGSNVTLVNNGVILGRGGNGGNGGSGAPNPTAGATGGPALRAQSLISITNNNRIAGGGGGGGGGFGASFNGDGGGGGIGVSSGGTSADSVGTAGTLTAAGLGGNTAGYSPRSIGWDASGNATGDSNGGDGGTYGAAGGHGADNSVSFPGGLGGAAGAAVNGNSNITWLATGTRNGAIT